MAQNNEEFDAVCEVFGALGERVERLGIHALSDLERAFYVVLTIDTGIASDGIYAVFHLCLKLLEEAPKALETVGLADEAAKFRELLALLPTPSWDMEERLRQVVAIQEEEPDRDEKIQGLQWEAFESDKTRNALFRFIGKHPEEFTRS